MKILMIAVLALLTWNVLAETPSQDGASCEMNLQSAKDLALDKIVKMTFELPKMVKASSTFTDEKTGQTVNLLRPFGFSEDQKEISDSLEAIVGRSVRLDGAGPIRVFKTNIPIDEGFYSYRFIYDQEHLILQNGEPVASTNSYIVFDVSESPVPDHPQVSSDKVERIRFIFEIAAGQSEQYRMDLQKAIDGVRSVLAKEFPGRKILKPLSDLYPGKGMFELVLETGLSQEELKRALELIIPD